LQYNCSSEGVGLGRHIEEEVQNSTGENLDPTAGGKVQMTLWMLEVNILRSHGQVQQEFLRIPLLYAGY
jgi:hypothetical protein